jgi:hypothetical protein
MKAGGNLGFHLLFGPLRPDGRISADQKGPQMQSLPLVRPRALPRAFPPTWLFSLPLPEICVMVALGLVLAIA